MSGAQPRVAVGVLLVLVAGPLSRALPRWFAVVAALGWFSLRSVGGRRPIAADAAAA